MPEPEFGEVSELESFDLGEPIRLREEVVQDDEVESPVILSVIAEQDATEQDIADDTKQYAEPEEVPEYLDGLEETELESVLSTEEYFGEALEELQEPEDYAMDDFY